MIIILTNTLTLIIYVPRFIQTEYVLTSMDPSSTYKIAVVVAIFLVLLFGLNQANLQKTLKVSEVLERKEDFLGKEIRVKGEVSAETVRCTMVECPEENLCCNSCFGNLALKRNNGTLTLHGKYRNKSVGCSGNNCNLTCWPLGRGEEYAVKGILKRSRGDYFLEFKGFSDM